MDNFYEYYVISVHKDDPYDSQPLCELEFMWNVEPSVTDIHCFLEKKNYFSTEEDLIVVINKLTGKGVHNDGGIKHFNVDDIYSTFQYNKRSPVDLPKFVIEADDVPEKFQYEVDGIVVTEDEYKQRIKIVPVKEMTLEEIEKELGYKIILKK